MKKNWRKIIVILLGCIICFLSISTIIYFIMLIRPIDFIAIVYFGVPSVGLVMGIVFLCYSRKIAFEYKGYFGSCSYSRVDKVYYGKIRTDNALVTYEADTYKALEVAFQEAVDDYLLLKKEVAADQLIEKECG